MTKKITLIAAAAMLATAFAQACATEPKVRFPKFKFQPNTTYEVEIFHKNIITFKFNDADVSGNAANDKKAGDTREKGTGGDANGAGKGSRHEVIPMENQVLFKATLSTSSVTKKNVMPVRMRINAFNTLIKSGDQMIPQKADPENDLKGKEFLGELDESGAIREVDGSPAPDSGSGNDPGMFELFSLIPSFPAGDYKAGAELYADAQGRFFNAGTRPGAWVFKYSIAGAKGDEVRIDSIDRTRFELVQRGEKNPLAGLRGEITYVPQHKIFSYVSLNSVSTSEPEKEDLKGRGVVVNNRVLWIRMNKAK